MMKRILILSVLVLLFVSPVLAQDELVVPYGSPSLFEILMLLVLLLIFVVQVYTAWRLRGDVGATARIRQEISNRENMRRYEDVYQSAGSGVRLAFDKAEDALAFISRLTPIESDDALADMMQDIQEPGPPQETVTVSTEAPHA